MQELLEEIIRQATEAKVPFGTIQVVDSTHTLADVWSCPEKVDTRKGV